MDLRSRNHPKLPTRFSVELGGRNDLGTGPVVYRTVGRVTLRFVKGENRPNDLGGRADRPSTAAARLGGRWRLIDAAPSEGRGSLRREDGVRPDNRRKDGTEAVKSIAHHLRSDGCR